MEKPFHIERVATGGRDPVSCRSFTSNQIHVSHILETAEFTNHMSFLAIFTHHGLIFALFHVSRTNFCPFHVSHINLLLPSIANVQIHWLFNYNFKTFNSSCQHGSETQTHCISIKERIKQTSGARGIDQKDMLGNTPGVSNRTVR